LNEGFSHATKEESMTGRYAAGLIAIALPLAAAAAPESFTVDPHHTFPYFEVIHLNTSIVRGRFDKTAGKMTLDTAAKTGTIELTVQTASLTTGDNDKEDRPRSRDEHLRSPDFFNVTEFPTMTFKGRAVKFNGDAPAEIQGELTLLGVTKPLTLTMLRWHCGPDPRSQGKRYFCGGNATGSFKRSDYGMKFIVGPVSDEVNLWMSMEAFRD
jgi:polyisoprenoid-binding protein YceI